MGCADSRPNKGMNEKVSDNSALSVSNRSVEISPLTQPGPRKSIQQLWADFQSGNKKPLEDLVMAFYRIEKKTPEDLYSFFAVAGLHGEPFVLRPEIDNLKNEKDKYTYWGGFCHHGNVLFPIWHRAYVLYLENCLQKAVPDAHMAYWDELSDEQFPEVFLQDTFTFSNRKTIKNPLKSYTLQRALQDTSNDSPQYNKPVGYETVRYPYSGLVGTEEDAKRSNEHNAKFRPKIANEDLIQNINNWKKGPLPKHPAPIQPHIHGTDYMFEECLKAPNYTVFSNTTSASAYNLSMANENDVVISVEQPHNDIHLAIGGFDWQDSSFGLITGSNGDMGENNTAAFDPVFFFHHCFIDYVFWEWQTMHGAEERLEIIPGYPGTSSFDSQGPTPGYGPNDSLNMDSKLYPFMKNAKDEWTAKEYVNIRSLGYDYEAPSQNMELREQRRNFMNSRKKEDFHNDKFVVESIDRTKIQGSALLVLYASPKKEPNVEYMIGFMSIFNRWNVKGCANCQTHLKVTPIFQPYNIPKSVKKRFNYQIKLITRKNTQEASNLVVRILDRQ
jgi:tyrosinase